MNNSLLHFEQFVNDRFGTSSAPEIAQSLLPESGAILPLSWRRAAIGSVDIFSTGSLVAQRVATALQRDGYVMIPVHPLDEDKWSGEPLVAAGRFQASASYRTVAYVPGDDDPLKGCVADDQLLMLKLHLDAPLPGIPGDRRLTRDKVEKCVLLSDALGAAMERDSMADQLKIVPEFLGFADADGGVLFRALPREGVMPLFSLGSVDRHQSGRKSLIQTLLESRYGDDSDRASREFGRDFARPLVRSLLAGFRAGFSMEMHAQNTLVEPGTTRLIDYVLYRDLEGVVLSNEFRMSRGMDALFPGTSNGELRETRVKFSRYFSRNYDHDLGRVFHSVLQALVASGYFDRGTKRLAVRGIRNVFREALCEAELGGLARSGRFMPLSRAPYGDGMRTGHYFRTTFR